MTKTAQDLLAKTNKLSKEVDELELKLDVPHLSVGCKSKLKRIWVAHTTGRKVHIESKYLEKGLMVEEDCITAYSLYTGEFHKKNKVRKENDWLIGEWDFTSEDDSIIVDTKGSWDLMTFYDSYFGKVDSGYNWQLQAYMMLGEKQRSKLVHALINTPKHLLDAEIKRVMYKMFGSEGNMELAPPEAIYAYNEEVDYIKSIHIFDDIPLEKKIKIFEVKRDEEKIVRIPGLIEDCRYYLNNIEKLNKDETDD
jgi:hypothetical protein